MRRSDYDITDSIRTTDPDEVCAEVVRLFRALYRRADPRRMVRAFADMSGMYRGEDPAYQPCDTDYHDLQHVLEVTLAMARLLHGYQREHTGAAPLPPRLFMVGIVCALFHDVGYLRRRADRRHRHGAEYTLTHVARGARFLRRYLPRIGLQQHAREASLLVHFTGYERDASTIRMTDPLMRRVGEMLGSADVIAQMSDRCYLEKCRDRLYPEFVLGGVARRRQRDGSLVVIYKSAHDLISKTPAFYANAMKRLDETLHGAYHYATTHFGGSNPYLSAMRNNARHAEAATRARARPGLRRSYPRALAGAGKTVPESLVIR
jgi:hypothetical protein